MVTAHRSLQNFNIIGPADFTDQFTQANIYPTEVGTHLALRKLIDDNFPVVTLDGDGRVDLDTDDVSTDYFRCAWMQVDYLLQIGRRRLCHIQTLPTCYTKEQCLAGAKARAKQQPECTLLSRTIRVPGNTGSLISDEMVGQIRSLLTSLYGKIDAVIGHDLVAAAALRAALELGIKAPDDLAIIGSDDTPIAANAIIPITSVAQPTHEAGSRAFELLKQRIIKPRNGSACERVKLQPQLVVRQSTPIQAHD